MAVAIGARGTPPMMEGNFRRILINTYSITVKSSLHYEELPIRRFPVFDRMKERVAISMAIKEDDQILTLLEDGLTQSIAAGYDQTVTNSTAELSKANILSIYGMLLSNGLTPGAFVTHPMRYASGILSFGQADIDQASLNVIIETGQFGVL